MARYALRRASANNWARWQQQWVMSFPDSQLWRPRSIVANRTMYDNGLGERNWVGKENKERERERRRERERESVCVRTYGHDLVTTCELSKLHWAQSDILECWPMNLSLPSSTFLLLNVLFCLRREFLFVIQSPRPLLIKKSIGIWENFRPRRLAASALFERIQHQSRRERTDATLRSFPSFSCMAGKTVGIVNFSKKIVCLYTF
jgi:hypothetical protein